MVTIRDLVFLVLLAALNCALIHAFVIDAAYFPLDGWPYWSRVAFVGSLPMAAVLGGCGYLAWSRGCRERPFLSGFVVSGLIAWIALMGVAVVLPRDWFTVVYRPWHNFSWDLYLKQGVTLGLGRRAYRDAADLVLDVGLFSAPEFLAATMGGFMARWYKLRNSLAAPHRPEAVWPVEPAAPA